jgi:hypothetical protein
MQTKPPRQKKNDALYQLLSGKLDHLTLEDKQIEHVTEICSRQGTMPLYPALSLW